LTTEGRDAGMVVAYLARQETHGVRRLAEIARVCAREGVVERELTVSCGLRVRHTERRRRRPVSECAVTLGAPPKISAPLAP